MNSKDILKSNNNVIVSVRGGVAYCEYNPVGINVIIIDYDNIANGDSQCPYCSEGLLVNGVCDTCGFDVNFLTEE